MPKYYNPTTGQVSDRPTTQGLSSSTGMANAGTSNLMGNDNNGLDIQKLFGLLELSKGNAGGAWNILKPAAEPAAAKKAKTQIKSVEGMFNQIQDEAMKADTGWKALKQTWLGWLPGKESEAEMLERDVKGYAKAIAAALAVGDVRATDEDVKRWADLMPRAKDTMAERIDRLTKLRAQLQVEASKYEVPLDLKLNLPQGGGATGEDPLGLR